MNATLQVVPGLTIIAAMAANRVIGRGGQLPWHLPADLKHLKLLTIGQPVIMGRRTFDSIKVPLPDRLRPGGMRTVRPRGG